MRIPSAIRTAPPATASTAPACPPHIQGEAKAEWDRVVQELTDLGTISPSDRAILILYCKAWERWTAAEAKINADTLMVASPKTKVPMVNPYINIANKAHEYVVKLAGELGLTPRARTIMSKNNAIGRYNGNQEQPADDFVDLD